MLVIRVRWAASEEQGEAITRMFSTQRAATPALAPVAPWLPPTLPYLFAQLPPPLLCSLVLSPPAVPEAASPAGIPSLRSGCLPSAELRVTARLSPLAGLTPDPQRRLQMAPTANQAATEVWLDG